MVSQLHNMGFKVTLWVMPFIEEASQAYKEGASKGYFVQSDRKRWFLKPGFFHWYVYVCYVYVWYAAFLIHFLQYPAHRPHNCTPTTQLHIYYTIAHTSTPHTCTPAPLVHPPQYPP